MKRNKPYEFADLATYNSEVARGIVHTEEWKRLMALRQEQFNAEQHAWYERQGMTVTYWPDTTK